MREIARNCAEVSLDEVATQTLLDLAQRISADPDLRSLSSAEALRELRQAGGSTPPPI